VKQHHRSNRRGLLSSCRKPTAIFSGRSGHFLPLCRQRENINRCIGRCLFDYPRHSHGANLPHLRARTQCFPGRTEVVALEAEAMGTQHRSHGTMSCRRFRFFLHPRNEEPVWPSKTGLDQPLQAEFGEFGRKLRWWFGRCCAIMERATIMDNLHPDRRGNP